MTFQFVSFFFLFPLPLSHCAFGLFLAPPSRPFVFARHDIFVPLGSGLYSDLGGVRQTHYIDGMACLDSVCFNSRHFRQRKPCILQHYFTKAERKVYPFTIYYGCPLVIFQSMFAYSSTHYTHTNK